jgi:hypothetical protein
MQKALGAPVPFLRDPSVSERPIAPRGPVSIKELAAHSRQNAVTVPVTPPCPKLFYMPLSDCHNGVVRVSLQVATQPSAGCAHGLLSRVPPHGKLASIGIWLRANDSAP